MATNFSTRYKKDLSIDILKTKLVRRKSTIQKENRYKEFNKGRQFGLVDVNAQPSRDKATSQVCTDLSGVGIAGVCKWGDMQKRSLKEYDNLPQGTVPGHLAAAKLTMDKRCTNT
uniref:Uncharacterized protein n=1 Tax=Pseudonaja textilis TaxID=8673 RepID=A0A670XR25_PSETE